MSALPPGTVEIDLRSQTAGAARFLNMRMIYNTVKAQIGPGL